jgi:hypothetical protein
MKKSTKDDLRKGFTDFAKWQGSSQRKLGKWELIFGIVLLSLVMGISLLLWRFFG